jgi:tetratricopeptide (TPR) repeat protein
MNLKVVLLFCGLILSATIACNNNDLKNMHTTQKNAVEYPEEVTNLMKQVTQHPDSVGLRLQLANAFNSLGAYKQAIAQMDSLLKKDTSNYGLWFTRAKILEDSQDTLQAQENYARAIKIYPSPDALLSLASLYAEQKNSRSLSICNEVKKMGLGREYDAHCAFIAGVYYARTRQKEKALKLFDECIRNNYTYMEAYIEKGLVYFDSKQYAEALQVFQFAGNVDNLYADAWYYQARCYEMLEIKDTAVMRYKQSLGLDKTLKEAHEGLKRLGAE